MVRDAAQVAADNAVVIARIAAALENPSLSNVSLFSESDGSRTSAPAILLASMSPVFLQMLTGPFAEGIDRSRKKIKASWSRCSARADTSSCRDSSARAVRTVRCTFRGEVLAAVVEFGATNDSPALSSGSVELLSEILEAGTTYDIPDLQAKACNRLIAIAEKEPEHACKILQTVWDRWQAANFGNGLAGKVAEAALRVIDGSEIGRFSEDALAYCGCLCEEAMKFILQRQSIVADEMVLFEALQRWLGSGGEGRASAGTDLATCLSLEKMSSKFLRDVVSISGLVPLQTLCDAFQLHAVEAESTRARQCPRRAISTFCWMSTGSTVLEGTVSEGCTVDGISCFIDSGTCTFVVLAEKIVGNCMFRLVVGNADRDVMIGSRAGLEYRSTGGAYDCVRSTKRTVPVFLSGDTIYLTVDYKEGSFKISVNGGTSFLIFSDIHDFGDGQALGLVLSVAGRSRFRLVDVR